MRHLIAVVLGSLFAVGCVGAVGEEGTGGDDDPNPNPNGKMGQTIYIRDVHPAMAKCSGGACHNSIASRCFRTFTRSITCGCSWKARQPTPSRPGRL